MPKKRKKRSSHKRYATTPTPTLHHMELLLKEHKKKQKRAPKRFLLGLGKALSTGTRRRHRRTRTTTKKRTPRARGSIPQTMGKAMQKKKFLPRIKSTYTSLEEQQTRSAAAWGRKYAEGPLKESRLTKRDPQGRLVGATGDITVMDIVISPRGRDVTRKGQHIPGAKPPKHMPQSTQDYFLTSRAIRYLAYDFKRKILEITFQTGHVYLYYGVESTLWYAFQNASSKGRFFHNRIYGEWRGPKGSKVYYPEYTYKRVS